MTLDDIVDDIAAELMGCPKPAIRRALLLTAQHVCRNAGIWQEQLDPTVIVKNVQNYEIQAGRGKSVQRILQVIDDKGNMLSPSSPYATDKTARPTQYWFDGAEMTVAPIPDEKVTLNITAVLIPDGINDLPDNIVAREADVLRAGALSKLRRQLGEQWGNAGLAQAADSEYQKLFGDARKRALQGQVGSRLVTQYRRLGY